MGLKTSPSHLSLLMRLIVEEIPLLVVSLHGRSYNSRSVLVADATTTTIPIFYPPSICKPSNVSFKVPYSIFKIRKARQRSVRIFCRNLTENCVRRQISPPRKRKWTLNPSVEFWTLCAAIFPIFRHTVHFLLHLLKKVFHFIGQVIEILVLILWKIWSYLLRFSSLFLLRNLSFNRFVLWKGPLPASNFLQPQLAFKRNELPHASSRGSMIVVSL